MSASGDAGKAETNINLLLTYAVVAGIVVFELTAGVGTTGLFENVLVPLIVSLFILCTTSASLALLFKSVTISSISTSISVFVFVAITI